jgi:hypothetical protein
LDIADSALQDYGLSRSPTVPRRCPFLLADFVAEEFRFEDAVAKLARV